MPRHVDFEFAKAQLRDRIGPELADALLGAPQDNDERIKAQRARVRQLKAILPKSVIARPLVFAALEVAVGFEAWRRMRQDLGLAPADAEQVMRFTVERLIGEA